MEIYRLLSRQCLKMINRRKRQWCAVKSVGARTIEMVIIWVLLTLSNESPLAVPAPVPAPVGAQCSSNVSRAGNRGAPSQATSFA